MHVTANGRWDVSWVIVGGGLSGGVVRGAIRGRAAVVMGVNAAMKRLRGRKLVPK